jgi:hypothetical protein
LSCATTRPLSPQSITLQLLWRPEPPVRSDISASCQRVDSHPSHPSIRALFRYIWHRGCWTRSGLRNKRGGTRELYGELPIYAHFRAEQIPISHSIHCTETRIFLDYDCCAIRPNECPTVSRHDELHKVCGSTCLDTQAKAVETMKISSHHEVALQDHGLTGCRRLLVHKHNLDSDTETYSTGLGSGSACRTFSIYLTLLRTGNIPKVADAASASISAHNTTVMPPSGGIIQKWPFGATSPT